VSGDGLTFLITIAHLRLRLERLRRQRTRNSMAIPNFAGLVNAMDLLEHELEAEATKLHQDIVSVKTRGLDAIGKGRDKLAGVRARVAQVETFVNKLEGSNGGPLSSSSTSSDASSQDKSQDKPPVDTQPTSAALPQASLVPAPAAAPEAPPAPIGAGEPASTTVLNVNGVAAS
jgi:hypothetical protein